MQIIFSRAAAEQLREKYTVLELETITKDGITVEAFCVIPAEKINLGELPELEHNIRLHEEFVSALKNQNHKICNDLYPYVKGKFGGELDSFYDIIIERIQNT
jgi:hypothetical protein